MDITTLFYQIDNFCQRFQGQWQQQLLSSGTTKRIKPARLTMSEIMTLLVYFHFSHYRTFKDYYNSYVLMFLRRAFPNLVSYNRFVELMEGVLIPLLVYLQQERLGKCSGISFVDSTLLRSCNTRRIHNHKVFKGIAQRGKTSMGWFYGFKLHLVVNDAGELLSFVLTPGNVDDRNPKVMEKLATTVWGKLFGDKGYLGQDLFNWLFAKGIQLITKLKKRMKNAFMSLLDKILLRKRAVIESINDQLKNIYHIEHSRHRSPKNFLVNLIAGLIAYSHAPKKHSLQLSFKLPIIL